MATTTTQPVKEDELVAYFRERSQSELQRNSQALERASRRAKLAADALGLHRLDHETIERLKAISQEQSLAMKEEWERSRADSHQAPAILYSPHSVYPYLLKGYWAPLPQPEWAAQWVYRKPEAGQATAVWKAFPSGASNSSAGHDTSARFTVDVTADSADGSPCTAEVYLMWMYRIPSFLFHYSGTMHVISWHLVTGWAYGQELPGLGGGTTGASLTEQIVWPYTLYDHSWKAFEKNGSWFMDKFRSDPFFDLRSPGHLVIPVSPGQKDVFIAVTTAIECHAAATASHSEIHADLDVQAGILAIVPM